MFLSHLPIKMKFRYYSEMLFIHLRLRLLVM